MSLHSNNELENPVANISSDSGNTSEVFEPVQLIEVSCCIVVFVKGKLRSASKFS